MAILHVFYEVWTGFLKIIQMKFRNRALSNIIRILCGPRQLSRYGDWLQAGGSGDRIPVGGEPERARPGVVAAQASIQRVPGHSWGYSGRGVALTTHPRLAPRLKKELSYISTPPLGLHGRL